MDPVPTPAPAPAKPAPAKARRPLWRKRLFALALGIAVSFAIGETVIRAMGTTDLDGNFSFLNVWIRPRRPRPKAVEARLRELTRRPDSYIMYDPTLGWTIRPSARSEDGLYASNSIGLRSAPTEYAPAPPAGRLRILLVGDSFTMGSDVAYEATWGARLETLLRDAGVDAEVLNLGVGAYGFDQVYLRWKSLGASLSAQVVILGFCQGDAERVVSLHWCFWHPTANGPFSKPRMFLRPDGSLGTVNSPTVPPERIIDWLAALPGSDLARYESAYRPADYEDHFWLSSRLIGVAEEALDPGAHWRQERGFVWAPGREAGALSGAIIDLLRTDVQAHGARFLAVSLPWRPDLQQLKGGRPLGSDAYLARLAESVTVVRPEAALLQAARAGSIDSLYMKDGFGHYSPEGNRIVARAVAEELLRERAK